MKQNTIKLMVAFLMLMGMSLIAKADNTLAVKNNTGDVIFVSIAWYSHGHQFWESKGWYKIDPYGEFVQPLHPLDLGSNTMYVCAQDGRLKSSGQSMFKVDPINAFDIFSADKFDAQSKTMNFSSVIVHQGQTVFTFNK